MTFAAIGAWVAEAVVVAAFEVGVTGLAYAALYYGVAAGVAMVGWSLVAQAFAPKAQSGPVGQANQGILLNTASTSDPLPVIYGLRKYGGTRTLAHVSDKSGANPALFPDASNAYLHVVIAHCEGEIDAVTGYWLDDKDTTIHFGANHWDKVTFLGADAQAACSNLVTAAPTIWTADHKLSGVAYTWAMFKFDRDTFQSVPTLTVAIRGRKCYDPRTATTAWSDNPAVVIRDYLLNARFGRGVAAGDIDDASFIAAANVCDTLVAVPGGGTQAQYRINAIVDTSQPALDNLRHMLTACRGVLVFTGGKYKLIIDQATAPTFTFSESNIVGAWSIKLGDKRSRFNRVRANWIDPANEWQPAITVRDSTAYRADDNGLVLEAQIDYPYVTDPYQVQRLADMHLKQSRFGTRVSFRATIAGMLCEVGDVVNITHPTPGWTDKPFRIMRIALLSSDEVEVSATEYDASVYAPDTLTVPRVSVATNLPIFGAPAAPTGLTLASGDTHRLISPDGIVTPRIYASWTAVADARVNEYEVQFRKTAESSYTSLFVPFSEVSTYLAPLQYGVGYTVRVRAVDLAGASSAWVSATHTVSASPSQPNDLPIDIQTFTSGGTWAKPSRGRLAKVECWGGGGSGGRESQIGGGGGGGSYTDVWIPLSAIGATETVTIGAGGASISTNAPGVSGGNTTFGAHVTAYGGQGGYGLGGNPLNPGGAGGGGSGNDGLNGAGDGARSGSTSTRAVSSPVAGGGGHWGRTVTGQSVGPGGASTYGGGGGGGGIGGTSAAPGGPGGSSRFGGAGGAGTHAWVDLPGGNIRWNLVAAATAGVSPGGGGGGSAGVVTGTGLYSAPIDTGPSGAGGNGQCVVTVW